MKPTLEILKNDLLHQNKELQRNLKHSYRAVRKNVREKPEQSLLIALVSGFVLGYLSQKVISDK